MLCSESYLFPTLNFKLKIYCGDLLNPQKSMEVHMGENGEKNSKDQPERRVNSFSEI